MTAKDRTKLVERIRKLFALAEDGGATIEEAAAAAAKARQLIAWYGFSRLDLSAAEMSEASVAPGRARRSEIDHLVPAIAEACGTLAFRQVGPEGLRFTYFGADPAPLIARYLHELCYGAIERATADFKKTPDYARRRTASTRRRAMKAFKSGMISILEQRLLSLGWMTPQERNRLAVLHAHIHGVPDMGASLKRPTIGSSFERDMISGVRAGRGVSLNRGVTGTDGRAPLIEQK